MHQRPPNVQIRQLQGQSGEKHIGQDDPDEGRDLNPVFLE